MEPQQQRTGGVTRGRGRGRGRVRGVRRGRRRARRAFRGRRGGAGGRNMIDPKQTMSLPAHQFRRKLPPGAVPMMPGMGGRLPPGAMAMPGMGGGRRPPPGAMAMPGMGGMMPMPGMANPRMSERREERREEERNDGEMSQEQKSVMPLRQRMVPSLKEEENVEESSPIPEEKPKESSSASKAKDILELYRQHRAASVGNERRIQDADEMKMLHACKKGVLSTIRELVALNRKAVLVKCLENVTNHTPLHIACLYNEGIEIVEFLLEHGADLEANCMTGQTAIQKAATQGNVDLVQYLIDRGAEYKTKELLHICARTGQKRLFRYCVSLGLDINEQDQWKYTPLHYAVEKERLEITLLLLALGADETLENYEKKKAQELSKTDGYKKIFMLLKVNPPMREYLFRIEFATEELEALLQAGGDKEKISLLELVERRNIKFQNLSKEFDDFKRKNSGLQSSFRNNEWYQNYQNLLVSLKEKEKTIKKLDKVIEEQKVNLENMTYDEEDLKVEYLKREKWFQKEKRRRLKEVYQGSREEMSKITQEKETIQEKVDSLYVSRIEETKPKVAELENEVAEIEKKLKSFDDNQSTVDQDLESKKVAWEGENGTLQSQLAELEKQLSEVGTAEENEVKVMSLEEKIGERDIEITETQENLQNDLRALEMNFEEEKAELETRITELEEVLLEKELELTGEFSMEELQELEALENLEGLEEEMMEEEDGLDGSIVGDGLEGIELQDPGLQDPGVVEQMVVDEQQQPPPAQEVVQDQVVEENLDDFDSF